VPGKGFCLGGAKIWEILLGAVGRGGKIDGRSR